MTSTSKEGLLEFDPVKITQSQQYDDQSALHELAAQLEMHAQCRNPVKQLAATEIEGRNKS